MIVGLGIDLVEVARIGDVLARHGDRFLSRCFTPDELRRPQEATHVAGLFAAKEAAFKALGTGWADGIGWHDIAVSHAPSGAPQIALRGAAARRAAELGAGDALVSITHTATAAAAVVVLQR